MKKQNLNEQISRIKGMMGLNENFESQLNEFGGYGFKKGDDKDIEWIIQNRMEPAFKKAFSPQELFYMPLDDEEKLYLYIKSNIDRDNIEDSKAYMKELIKKDKVDKYIKSKKMVNKSYDYDKEEESYISQKEDLINRYKNGEIDKETYENADEYLENNHYDFWMDGLGVDYVLKQINKNPEIGDQSSVEDDDYDEKQERNYGVDDEPSDDEIYNGFGREGGISYDTGDSWQGR